MSESKRKSWLSTFVEKYRNTDGKDLTDIEKQYLQTHPNELKAIMNTPWKKEKK